MNASKKLRVVLDTNVLLLYGRGFDVLRAAAEAVDGKPVLVVPECVLAELEKLAQRQSKEGRAAKLAYTIVQQRLLPQPLLNKLLFKEIPLKTVRCSKQHADDAILAIAEDDSAGTVVVTLDKALQRRLLKAGIRVLTRHQQTFSEVH